MKIILYPDRKTWASLTARPQSTANADMQTVSRILQRIREEGEEALLELTGTYDGVIPDPLEVTAPEMEEAEQLVAPGLADAIGKAAAAIRSFHAAQRPAPVSVETFPGVECRLEYRPLERVGLYIPGGTAPLFSTVLMLAIPAREAGCRELILCTPPDRQGKINPAILYAARLSGVDRVFRCGGAQAIGAMAYGAGPVPAVDKIFGPGNRFVTLAKQLVNREGIPIDMPAGPSELAVIADQSADPVFVASDLLSQAEHGADSQVLLVTTDEGLARAVAEETGRQLESLPRKELAQQSLAHSRVLVLRDMEEAMELVNAYAPEHLIIQARDAEEQARKVRNAGSVFIGPWSPESAGDYASGTNHTLPTNGFARSWSGVTLGSFMKSITFQRISPEGLQLLGPVTGTLAAAEGLEAHRRAVTVRLQKLEQS